MGAIELYIIIIIIIIIIKSNNMTRLCHFCRNGKVKSLDGIEQIAISNLWMQAE